MSLITPDKANLSPEALTLLPRLASAVTPHYKVIADLGMQSYSPEEQAWTNKHRRVKHLKVGIAENILQEFINAGYFSPVSEENEKIADKYVINNLGDMHPSAVFIGTPDATQRVTITSLDGSLVLAYIETTDVLSYSEHADGISTNRFRMRGNFIDDEHGGAFISEFSMSSNDFYLEDGKMHVRGVLHSISGYTIGEIPALVAHDDCYRSNDCTYKFEGPYGPPSESHSHREVALNLKALRPLDVMRGAPVRVSIRDL